MPLWAVLLLDVLVLAICLSGFCYLHHIKELWGGADVAPHVTEPPLMVITRPPKATADATPALTTPAVPVTDTTTGPTGTVPLPETTEPPLDTTGDFGAQFATLFAKEEGEVNRGADYYQSHDVYIRVESVEKQMLQQPTKSSTSKKNTQVRYHLMHVYVRNIDNLFTAYGSKNQSFDALLKGTGALAAISGDVFLTGTSSKEIIIRNGNVIRKKDYISSDICVLYWDGTMETITPAEYNWDRLLAKSPYQVWSFGPELLHDDGSAKTNISTSVWRLNPRSAIGYVEPGHYVLLSVDGNRDGKTGGGDGLNMDEMAKVLSEAGCKQAYNLDGGASVYGYFDGDLLVSFPGERKISDIICIGEVG